MNLFLLVLASFGAGVFTVLAAAAAWSSTKYDYELDKVFLIMQELENKIGRVTGNE